MVSKNLHILLASAFAVYFCCIPDSVLASRSIGHLSGLVLDETGQPLPDILVSLEKRVRGGVLPTLTRTNERGRLHLTNLDSGTYRVLIKSADYKGPAQRLVQILPNRTVVITVILQHLLDLSADGSENVGVKALLRTSTDHRLIFRNVPVTGQVPPEESSRFFEDAVIQVFSNAGPGGDFFVHPGDSWAGTTTNFAVVDSVEGAGEYIFAGQLNSGQDSMWRIRNVFDRKLGENHSLRMFFGYGRMSFEQPSLALLNNPSGLSSDTEFTSAVGRTKLFSAGVEDHYQLASALALSWGIEVDQLRSRENDVFVSPSAKIEYLPREDTAIRLSMASRRSTLGNSVSLPDGRQIGLSSPIQIAQIGDRLSIGTTRYYQGIVTHSINSGTEVEVAYFDNIRSGGGLPVVAFLEFSAEKDVLQLTDTQLRTSGYRATVRRQLTHNIKAAVSYLRGQAPGMVVSENIPSFDGRDLSAAISSAGFNAFATQIDTYIPISRTQVTALLKLVPKGKPLTPVDAQSDIYETGNEGVNLFVRQVIPLPVGLLSFIGLEFLAPESVEALLDIRNITNEDSGEIETTAGKVTLVQNPRSFRGGISFRF